jgi:hypothetical protein
MGVGDLISEDKIIMRHSWHLRQPARRVCRHIRLVSLVAHCPQQVGVANYRLRCEHDHMRDLSAWGRWQRDWRLFEQEVRAYLDSLSHYPVWHDSTAYVAWYDD